MILYFSGTGNSKYVAEQIEKRTKDGIISINALIKQGNEEDLVSENEPFVFVCPTYCWRIPRVVEKFIRSRTFIGSNKVYFVMTCGDDTLNAIKYIKRLCKDKGWELQGFAEIVMPENYIAMFPTPSESAAKDIIKAAEPMINKVTGYIENGSTFSLYKPSGILGKLKSGIINDLYYPFCVSAKGFYATDKCISCGKCLELCPLNNIEISSEKPMWKDDCTHCMACICGCPTEAIEYKNKSQGKRRYFLE